MENSPVTKLEFNKDKGLWTIFIEGSDRTYTARVSVVLLYLTVRQL